MKLFYSPASPYARKVLVCAHELNMADQVETITISPFTDEEYRATNPLGKVPALATEDVGAIYDSIVICEYLDQKSASNKLFPVIGPERIKTLCLHALGQGMTDAALNLRQNTMRGDGDGASPLPEDWYVERQFSAIAAGMDEAERLVDDFIGDVNIGTISIACFFEYWDFRFADHVWRGDYPALANWMAEFSARPSMVATQPS